MLTVYTKYSILDAWRGYEYVCVQIAPGNVLCYHNKYLMGYFEFLQGSGIICLPLNILEKLSLTICLRKTRKGRDSSPSFLLSWHNTHTPWRTTFTIQSNGEHHHSFIWIPILQLILLWSILLTTPMFWW